MDHISSTRRLEENRPHFREWFPPEKPKCESFFDGHIQEKNKIYRKIYPKIYIYIYTYVCIPVYPCVLGVLHHFYKVIRNNDGWSMDLKGSYF